MVAWSVGDLAVLPSRYQPSVPPLDTSEAHRQGLLLDMRGHKLYSPWPSSGQFLRKPLSKCGSFRTIFDLSARACAKSESARLS